MDNTAPPPEFSGSQPPQGDSPTLVVDQKLLDRALKRLQGLVKGNGADPADVRLIDTKGIRMYRFAAQTRLKIVAHYGTRPEFGKNTKAELAATEEDFRRILNTIPHDTATVPERRQSIVDIIFARSDKGFGIKEQQMSFHALRRYIVRHEKCIHCHSIGYIPCGTCHGNKVSRCVNCQGRRHSVCPKCRGSGQIHGPKGMIPCDFCRHDGRITCPKCAGRGNVRCLTCGGTGNTVCQHCGKTGWISHLATVDIAAQIKFDFDHENLPPLLINHLESNPARLVERNDIEVALATGWAKSDDTVYNTDKATPEAKLADTIILDYSVMCPTGPLRFAIGSTEYDAHLFGFQARIINSPPFLDTLTADGQTALLRAAKSKNIRSDLATATRFALMQDILSKILINHNLRKTHHILCEKYATGIEPDKIGRLVKAADIALRRSTRMARYIGTAIGLLIFTLLYAFLVMGVMLEGKFPQTVLWGFYALIPIIGFFIVAYLARIIVVIAQTRILSGIVAADILHKHAPHSKILTLWIGGGIVVITVAVLGYAFIHGDITLPFLAKIPVTGS